MTLKLNKFDIILILITLLLGVLLLFITYQNINLQQDQVAKVYYRNKLVYTFDLTNEKKDTFEIEATKGKLIIIKEGTHVRVIEEQSNKHLCSLQGWSDQSIAPIVCLPNELYIKVEGRSSDDVDVFIK
ncbi:MAG: NusG domain II-containing protein [Bacilli bacterium]|jgi:hypothetical protein|nr:NusG domain II-containing protein [Bacilli bacterium]